MEGKTMIANRNASHFFIVADEGERGSLNSAYPSATQPEVCLLCLGSGWESVLDKGVRPCRCHTEDRRAKLFAAAKLPRRHRECTLANYYPEKANSTQLRAFSYAYRLIEEYPAIDRGLLFMGPVGVGKTHLSVAILRSLIGKSIPGLFYDFGSLLKEIQKSYNPVSQTSEMEILAPIYETEVLVLDELGASKPTEWVCDTLRQIIGRRYNDKKLTIFTTNYLDERTAPAVETLEDRIGARLRSRLYEMCRTMVIEGQDYRRKLDAEMS
jgi:DNA replication protein DnaC